jgi:glutaredoxin
MMKIDSTDIILAGLVFFLVVLLVFRTASYASDTGGGGANNLSVADKGNIIVYGSKTCPWCIKQEKYLIDNGIPYTFVNCPTETCPEFVSGFPTIMINDQVKVGYTEV